MKHFTLSLAFFSALMLLPLSVRGQQPSPSPSASPDWKTAYEAANDAAAKWKQLAESKDWEIGNLKGQIAVIKQQSAQATLPEVGVSQTRAASPVAQADLRPGATRDTSGIIHVPFNMPLKTHVHLIDYGGPNEFMTFLGADALAVHLRIGVGEGKLVNVPLHDGLQTTGTNRTAIYSDGQGCTVYYLSDIRSGGYAFEADYQPGAMLPPKQVGYSGPSKLSDRIHGTAPKDYVW